MTKKLPRRKCSKCGEEKALSKVHYGAGRRHKYKKKCKVCVRKECSDWYEKNKLKKHLYTKRWREENPDRNKYANIKHRAAGKNKDFSLSMETYQEHFWNKKCFYCGKDSFGGVDRVDNNKGYILKNCAPCCTWCSSIKMGHTVEEMFLHIQIILNNKKDNT